MEPVIAVFNAGSSSLKFAFYEGDHGILSGQFDGIGIRPAAKAFAADGTALEPPNFAPVAPTTPSDVLPVLIPWAKKKLGGRQLVALGHRVVHGGMRRVQPERITRELLAELEALIPLAPLHQPHNLTPIRTALALDPTLVQVACFDTAFHRSMPEVAQAFALTRELHDEGIRRYGFHGLSYEVYCFGAAGARTGNRAWARGSGTSRQRRFIVCAERSRSRSLRQWVSAYWTVYPWGPAAERFDPGVILHLLQHKRMSPEGGGRPFISAIQVCLGSPACPSIFGSVGAPGSACAFRGRSIRLSDGP